MEIEITLYIILIIISIFILYIFIKNEEIKIINIKKKIDKEKEISDETEKMFYKIIK